MKKILLLLMLFSYQSLMAQSRVVRLDDGWRCQSSAVTDGTWYEATVPSTVMGVLTSQRGARCEYPDILESLNYKRVDASRFRVPWIYERDFDLDGLSPQEHVSLIFEGIGYSANIRLNGVLVASRDTVRGPFRTYEIDVTRQAREHNTLSVEVFAAQPGDPNIGFVDWNPWPADQSMGIWRPVSVKRSGAVVLSHPFVKTRLNLTTLDEAWLTVETDIRNLSGQACSGQLTGELEGKRFSLPYSLKPYETKTLRISADDTSVLHVRNPRLWWCYTLGKPELYTLRLQAGQERSVSDETQLIYNYLDHNVRAVNSLLDAVNVMARMKVYGVSGQLLQKQEKRLTIPANGHVDAFQLEPLSEANGYLFLEINGTTNVYALSADSDVFDWDNSTWYDTPLLHQADHKAIGASRIDGCRISETHKIVDGKTVVTLTVTNPTDRVAYLLQLSLRTPKGKLIDGVTFSDNYISLEPNSSCEVSCEFDGQQKFKAQIEGRD